MHRFDPRRLPVVALFPFLLVFHAVTALPVHARDDSALVVEQIQWWAWPTGMRSIFTAAMSEDGDVVVSGVGDNGIAGGYRLRLDGWELFYATENGVADVNDAGFAVGHTSGRPLVPSSDVHAFVVGRDGDRQISEPVEPPTAVDVRAVGIDTEGTVYGQAILEIDGTRSIRPFRWGDAFEVLELTIGEARASNDAGRMVFREYTDAGYVLRILEADDSVTQLPIPVYAWTSPNDINVHGHVVGDAEDADYTRDEAFLWDGQDYTILPRPAGFTQADAEAIDDQGRIVGWGGSGDLGAIVWDGTEPYDLTALAREAIGESLDLYKAFDISNSGWVVGWGRAAGQMTPQVFLLKLGRGCRAPEAIQDVVRWDAPSSGLFDDADNWSTGEVPDRDAVLRFDTGTAGTVSVVDDLIHRSLLLHPDAVDPVFDLEGATWILEGSDPCLRSLYTLPIEGVSTYTFSGGIVRAERGVEFAHRGRSEVVLRNGAQFLVDGDAVSVGHADSTSVAIEDGSAIRFGPEGMVLGALAGEHGEVVMIGDDNALTGSDLVVGEAGSGALQVLGFSVASNRVQIESLRAAHAPGSSAELIFTSDGFLEASVAEIGVGGDATLEVGVGFFVGAVSLELAQAPSSRAELDVSSGAFVAAGDARIGRQGSGLVSVRDGGTFQVSRIVGAESTGGLRLAEEDGSRAQVDVSGEGSTLQADSASIGVRGMGLLEVLDSANVEIAGTTVLGELLDQGSGGIFAADGGRFNSDVILVGSSGLLQTAAVDTELDGVIEVRSLVVLDGGFVEGNVIELSGSANRELARRDDPPSLTVVDLDLRAGATLDVASARFGTGWSLRGNGTFPTDVVNTGLVEPGGGDVAGTLTIDGDYEQQDGGVLRIALRADDEFPARRVGLQSDRIVVTGTARLGGTLELVLTGEVVVDAGDSFRLLDAAGVEGSFESVIAPDGMQVDLIPTADGLEVGVVTPPVRAVTIEPALRDDSNVLAWETSSSIDDGHFVVEGATARESWARLGVVPVETGVHFYRWALGATASDIVRFRVAWLDADGLRRTSPAVTREAPAAVLVRATPVRPNPFNPRAGFTLSARHDTDVRVRILDVRGRVVDVLYDGPLAAGSTRVLEIDGTDWSSGVYLLHVEGEGVRHTQKIALVE